MALCNPCSENPAAIPYSEPVQTKLLRFGLIFSFHLDFHVCPPTKTRFPIRATCDVHHYGIAVPVEVG
jgi:hypothetical protein